ncbi:hypothetical protein HN011_005120 [Eciton burchellii]|nr:hypothetical protein HN011_005120 [Eciton burchellii]
MAKSEYGSKCCPLFLACALCRVGEPRGRDILIEHDRAVDTLDLVATSSSIARYCLSDARLRSCPSHSGYYSSSATATFFTRATSDNEHRYGAALCACIRFLPRLTTNSNIHYRRHDMPSEARVVPGVVNCPTVLSRIAFPHQLSKEDLGSFLPTRPNSDTLKPVWNWDSHDQERPML